MFNTLEISKNKGYDRWRDRNSDLGDCDEHETHSHYGRYGQQAYIGERESDGKLEFR